MWMPMSSSVSGAKSRTTYRSIPASRSGMRCLLGHQRCSRTTCFRGPSATTGRSLRPRFATARQSGRTPRSNVASRWGRTAWSAPGRLSPMMWTTISWSWGTPPGLPGGCAPAES
ncbi:UNVERIFIED_CONTAM: hypothetical protein GTU68_020561 [Idotea baltica]|nr:hypothetical protein [Idotea baltica]